MLHINYTKEQTATPKKKKKKNHIQKNKRTRKQV